MLKRNGKRRRGLGSIAQDIVTGKCCLAGVIVCGLLFARPVSAQTDFQHRFKSAFPSNADSCASCHSLPELGGSSKVMVTRVQLAAAGPPSNSLVLHLSRQSEAATGDSTRGERLTLSLIGDGYIEAIDEGDIRAAQKQQHLASNGRIAGTIVRAPVLESRRSETAIGKFGWKGQHSSLASACADSMLNELGVPNRLYPAQGTVRNDDDLALTRIVAFVRLLPPPERDRDLAGTEDAVRGEKIFSQIGCSLCHVPTMTTLPSGTAINGGTYRIPEQVGNKEIHPYSDFLLHDVGTGDGILQAATSQFIDPATANRFRTPPLWGLRYRVWLMHDGKAVTLHQAIMRHAGEASDVVAKYEKLTPKERHELDQFLNSL